MNDNDFDDLVNSIKQAGKIKNGKMKNEVRKSFSF